MAQDATTAEDQPDADAKVPTATELIAGTMTPVDGVYGGQQPPPEEPEDSTTTDAADPAETQEPDNRPALDPNTLDFTSLSLDERKALVQRVAEENPLALANGFMRQADYTKSKTQLAEERRAAEQTPPAAPPPAQQAPVTPSQPQAPQSVYPHQFDAANANDVTQFNAWMQEHHGREATGADVAGLQAARAVQPLMQQLDQLTASQEQAAQVAMAREVVQAGQILGQQFPEIIGDPAVQAQLGNLLDNLDPTQVTADVVVQLFHGQFHERVSEARNLRDTQGQQATQQGDREAAAAAQPPPSGGVEPPPPKEPEDWDDVRQSMLDDPDLMSALETTAVGESDVYTKHLKKQ